MRIRTLGICGVIAAVAALSLIVPAQAAMSIKATVNGDPITTYDIEQRAKLLQLTSRFPAAKARKEALEELIDEKLKIQESQRLGISVSDDDVEQAFAMIAERVKLSPANLTAALRQNGVDPDTLKARLRVQLGWNQTIGARAQQSTVREQEVIDALRRRDDEATAKEVVEYDLSQITFVVPKSADKAKEAARKQEISNLGARFTSCEQGLELARKLPDVVVKQLGKRLETELTGPFVPLVKETKVGGLSAPLRTPDGFEAVAVCGKRDLRSSAAAVQELSAELRTKDMELTARRYIRDLRRNAMVVYK